MNPFVSFSGARGRYLLATLFLFSVLVPSLSRAGEGAESQTIETQGAVSDADRIERLETRVAELERLLSAVHGQLTQSLGGATSEPAITSLAQTVDPVPGTQTLGTQTPGSANAPDGSTAVTRDFGRMPYGGYTEVHFNSDKFEPETFDLHRFVLLFGHQFSDKIRFQGEIEIEHGLVEGGEESGELEIEQAYLDFSILPSLTARAGMMLTPMGIVNEKHEPASFNGVERPFVDTFVIPSTWFANGAGVTGRFGNGFSYRAYFMSPLNAAFFNAEEGFRGGRQKGFFDDASDLAASFRLEYTGIRDLALGASYWNGNTGFEFADLSANAQLLEFDARYRIGRFDLAGQYVTTHLDDSAELNRALQRRSGINPNIAEEMLGYYLEGAVHLRPRSARLGLVAFYRFEKFNTQEKMAPGFLPLGQFDRSANTLGLTFLPHRDIALKVDYNFLDNESTFIEPGDKWNLGLGWWF